MPLPFQNDQLPPIPLALTPNAITNPLYRNQQAFWDPGALVGQSIDCLLPDVSVMNILPDRWNWDVIYMAGQHERYCTAHQRARDAGGGVLHDRAGDELPDPGPVHGQMNGKLKIAVLYESSPDNAGRAASTFEEPGA